MASGDEGNLISDSISLEPIELEGQSCLLEGSLEGCLEDCNQRLELSCDICKDKLRDPKVLSCLHSFCKTCLEKKVEELTAPVDGEPTKPFICPVQNCEHEMILPGGKVCNLLTDFVAIDMLKPKSEKQTIICTSCKAQEEAIARCQDCPNFLCTNCSTAHQFMRCFEDHTVRTFAEILDSGGSLEFSKPVLCPKHIKENLVAYCKLCEVAVCQKCMSDEHLQPEHVCLPLGEAEPKVIEELQKLIDRCQNKLNLSHDEHQRVDVCLGELSMQRDNAKGLITEAIISYKALLDEIKDKLLRELEEKNNKIELQLMDTFHLLDVHETRLESACSFADRLLKHDCPTYAAMFSRMIRSQLISLLTKPPKTDFKFHIEFKTEPQAFEAAVRQNFGWWVTDEPKIKHPTGLPLASAHSSFENEANYSQLAAASMMSPEEMVAHVTDSEFLSVHNPISSMSALAALTGGNLENLANLTHVASSLANAQPVIAHLDSSISRSSVSPALSDSGISVDNASTNSNNSATMIQNAAAMAKLTTSVLGSQAILGSSMGGMSRASPSSISSGPVSRTITPMSHGQPSEETIRSILAMSPTSHVTASPVTSVQGNLDQLASLLHSNPPPSIPGMSSLHFSTLSGLDGASVASATSDNDAGASDMVSGSLSPTGSMTGSGASLPYPPVRRANRMSAMQIRCKFGQLGPGKGQFNSPHGFCLGVEQDIIVADTNNHRIQVFEKTGEFKTQFGVPGREEGQLWYPRKVAVMRPSGKFVVCDRGNERSRMQIFNRNGHFLKKIAIRYIDIVAGLAITASGNIVAVDSVSPTVFVISEAGDLIKWFDCSDYMREPSDIAVSNKEYFVCDFKGHCVVVFNEEGVFQRRIGCENITNYPNGIDISDAGDVLIGDSHGNRFHVAVFQRDGSLIGEFQCPYVKVSRCCGLKITLEGYIVTLAKNNHHVLVLNTLYIT